MNLKPPAVSDGIPGAEARGVAERAATRFIAQRESGPWGEGERAALEAWLSQATLHRVVYYRLNAAWQEAGRLQALKGALADASGRAGCSSAEDARGAKLDGVKVDGVKLDGADAGKGGSVTARQRAPGWARRRPFALAASVGMAALLLYLLLPLGRGVTYGTAVGAVESVPLVDGSRVTLNTDSRVRIELEARERRVDLDRGEAFFEVAKDSSRPFVVHVGRARVVAVGTQFSVRRDGDGAVVRVAEGVVRLRGAGSSDGVEVRAGGVARAQGTAVVLAHASASDIERTLSWRLGVLSFHDTPLREAVAEFNRYNRRQLVIEDPELASLEVGGRFGATSLEPFVALLKSGFAVDVIDEGDRLVLRRRP